MFRSSGLRGTAASKAAQPGVLPNCSQRHQGAAELTSHYLRAQRRHAARRKQEEKIHKLEASLQDARCKIELWEKWWYGVEVEENHRWIKVPQEIAGKLQWVAADMEAQRLAAMHFNADFHNAGLAYKAVRAGTPAALSEAMREVHRAANSSKHSPLSSTPRPSVDPHGMLYELKLSLHHNDLDIFALLAGMCETMPSIINAGGILVPGPDVNETQESRGVPLVLSEIASGAGDSLVNIAIDRRALHHRAVLDTRRTIEDAEKFYPPHVFAENDIVYVGDDTEPSVVVRIGYGSYLHEVRVRHISESDVFEAGRWVMYTRLFLLELGDSVVATTGVEAATEDRTMIPANTLCRFAGIDTDGDVLLDVPSAIGRSRRIVFWSDFRCFSLK